MDEDAMEHPECRCGLPMLLLVAEDIFWACATCDQGAPSKGKVLAAHWFGCWQRRRQAQLEQGEG